MDLDKTLLKGSTVLTVDVCFAWLIQLEFSPEILHVFRDGIARESGQYFLHTTSFDLIGPDQERMTISAEADNASELVSWSSLVGELIEHIDVEEDRSLHIEFQSGRKIRCPSSEEMSGDEGWSWCLQKTVDEKVEEKTYLIAQVDPRPLAR